MLIANPLALPSPPSLLARFQYKLGRLASLGVDLAKTLTQYCADLGAAVPPTTAAARTQHQIKQVLPRVARGVTWAIALSHVLAGILPLPIVRRRTTPAQLPAAPKAVIPIRSIPLITAASHRLTRRPSDSWMRHVFATRSIGDIVVHICYDLGMEDDDEDWPSDLAGLRQTPAELLNPPAPAKAPAPAPAPTPPTPSAPAPIPQATDSTPAPADPVPLTRPRRNQPS